MKKKLLCMLFAMALILSLAACGGGSDEKKDSGAKDDFASFMEVQDNMRDIKDMEFKMDMNASSPENKQLDMTMSGTAREVIKSKDDVQMEMKYNMNLAGMDMKGTMYMKDKMLYMELMGQKIKMDASSEMGAAMNADTSDLLGITKEMISELKVSQDGGDTVYTFKLDPNKAIDYFRKNAGSAEELAKSTESLKFDKMNVTVVAGKDKMVKKLDLDFSMNVEENGKINTMNYKMTMDYVSINAGFTIDFPDFSSYKEMPSAN